MVFVSTILNFLRQERKYRATTALLHAMDDHLLQDIGVRRDQIDTLVAEQRKIKRQHAAVEAEDKRNTQSRHRAVDGHGLAAQH